jgi:hypothetical protein
MRDLSCMCISVAILPQVFSAHRVQQCSAFASMASRRCGTKTKVAARRTSGLASSGTSSSRASTGPDDPDEDVLGEQRDVDEFNLAGADAVPAFEAEERTKCHECPRLLPKGKLINGGCARYPLYRDKACHNAVRALERGAVSQGEKSKAALSELRKKRPDLFAHHVKMIRVKPDDEEPLDDDSMDIGVAEGERVTRVQEILTTITYIKEVSEKEEVIFLHKKRFICHYHMFEGFTKDDAAKKWERDFNNKNIARMNDESENVCLAVKLPVSIATCRKAQVKRGIDTLDPNVTEQDMPILKRARDSMMQEFGDQLLRIPHGLALLRGAAAVGGVVATGAKTGPGGSRTQKGHLQALMSVGAGARSSRSSCGNSSMAGDVDESDDEGASLAAGLGAEAIEGLGLLQAPIYMKLQPSLSNPKARQTLLGPLMF